MIVYLVTQLFLSAFFISSQVMCNQNLNNLVENNSPTVSTLQNSFIQPSTNQQQQGQQQQQQTTSNQSAIVPLLVNLPGQTNSGSNFPIESPALPLSVPLTSSTISNMPVTSSISIPPSPVESADNRQVLLGNGSIVSMSSLLSSPSQQQQQQTVQQNNNNHQAFPSQNLNTLYSNNFNSTNTQNNFPKNMNNPFEISLPNNVLSHPDNHSIYNQNNLPTSNGLSKQQNAFINSNQNKNNNQDNMLKFTNFNNNNNNNSNKNNNNNNKNNNKLDKLDKREKSLKKDERNSFGSVRSLDVNMPVETTASIPSNANEKNVNGETPKSIDGIIDLLKTFTGNSSLDVNNLKEHLLQETSEHAKEDAIDFRNSELRTQREHQIEQFQESEREKVNGVIMQTLTEKSSDALTTTTIKQEKGTESTTESIFKLFEKLDSSSKGPTAIGDPFPIESSSSNTDPVATEASTLATEAPTTVKPDPVQEVANDPELQKKLLEQLLVQEVAKGDTQVMESIVQQVNNADRGDFESESNSKTRVAATSLEPLSSEKVFSRSNSLENSMEDSKEDQNSQESTSNVQDSIPLDETPKSDAVKATDFEFYEY